VQGRLIKTTFSGDYFFFAAAFFFAGAAFFLVAFFIESILH
jgi:hypothetical protein